jgi:transposase-like protein
MAKRRRYTDKFKAGAVVMVESEGYPGDKYALGRVADKLKINKRTLRRWVENDTGAPDDEIVTQEKNGIIDLIDAEIEAAFKEMPSARGEASYRDLVIGTATLIDKKQLLIGEPTERTENTHDIDGVIDIRTDIQRRLARISASHSSSDVSGQPDADAT